MGLRGAKTGSLCVAFVAALALLTACSGDAPEPSQISESKQNGNSDRHRPPEKPEPKPTPTGPERSNHEQELYDATVTFYETITEAYKTLDTAPVKRLVVPGSDAGVGYTNYIEEVEAKGHKFGKAPVYSIGDFEFERDGDQTIDSVTFEGSHDGLDEVDESGKSVGSLPPESAKVRVTFKKQGDSWLVLRQDILE